MGIVVQKFGGTSVADKHHIFNVAKKVIPFYEKGNDVIVVVSAQGDTTDNLIKNALSINPTPPKREMDALLSTGEQISASLLAMAIESLGFPAVSLSGWQAGISTDSNFSNASILKILNDRISAELSKKNIVVITGFQGIDSNQNITTLGRGGSDTSAVAIAGEIKSDICKIYTDVDGVYTADPRIVPSARKLDSISYEEMFKLSSLGAQVLNDVSIQTAEKYGVEVEVLSSISGAKGTIVKKSPKLRTNSISGIAIEKNMVKVMVSDIDNLLNFKNKVIKDLVSKRLIKDPELKPVALANTQGFLVEESSLTDTLKYLEESCPNSSISYQKNKSEISVVNLAESLNVNIASIVFELLHELNINIEMAACDESRISIVVESENLYHAVNSIHSKLFEEDFLM